MPMSTEMSLCNPELFRSSISPARCGKLSGRQKTPNQELTVFVVRSDSTVDIVNVLPFPCFPRRLALVTCAHWRGLKLDKK